MFATLGRAAAALVIAGGMGLFSAAMADNTTTTTTTPVIEIKDFGIGDPNAKVKMVEYLSFTCPHCERFHADVFPKLKADYIDTGKVRLEYHEVYFDKYGLWAAMLARCGGEMRYFGITDILFDTLTDWLASDDPATVVEALKKIGRTAGMDDATLDACLKDQAMAEALVTHFQQNITTDFPDDSFGGTPSFIINGTVQTNTAYDDLKKILDAELAK